MHVIDATKHLDFDEKLSIKSDYSDIVERFWIIDGIKYSKKNMSNEFKLFSWALIYGGTVPDFLIDVPTHTFYKDENLYEERWCDPLSTLIGRDNGPSSVYYYPSGNIRMQWWYDNSRRAKTFKFYENGQIQSEEWFKNNVKSRLDGPAVVEYYENGQIKCEEWLIDGQHTREDGPACISFYPNGKLREHKWFFNGDNGMTPDHTIPGLIKHLYDEENMGDDYVHIWYDEDRNTHIIHEEIIYGMLSKSYSSN